MDKTKKATAPSSGLHSFLEAAARRLRPVRPARNAEVVPTCGWFDSSYELAQGLLVRELNSPESLAAALPLVQWLDQQQATRQWLAAQVASSPAQPHAQAERPDTRSGAA